MYSDRQTLKKAARGEVNKEKRWMEDEGDSKSGTVIQNGQKMSNMLTK